LSESRVSGPGLRLEIPKTSPSCGVLPGFAIDRSRCEFGHVVAFPPSDPASGGVGRRSGLGPLLPLEVSANVDVDRVPYANKNRVSSVGTRLVIL